MTVTALARKSVVRSGKKLKWALRCFLSSVFCQTRQTGVHGLRQFLGRFEDIQRGRRVSKGERKSIVHGPFARIVTSNRQPPIVPTLHHVGRFPPRSSSATSPRSALISTSCSRSASASRSSPRRPPALPPLCRCAGPSPPPPKAEQGSLKLYGWCVGVDLTPHQAFLHRPAPAPWAVAYAEVD